MITCAGETMIEYEKNANVPEDSKNRFSDGQNIFSKERGDLRWVELEFENTSDSTAIMKFTVSLN